MAAASADDDYNFDTSQLLPSPTFSQRLWSKTKKDPFVPIGCHLHYPPSTEGWTSTVPMQRLLTRVWCGAVWWCTVVVVVCHVLCCAVLWMRRAGGDGGCVDCGDAGDDSQRLGGQSEVHEAARGCTGLHTGSRRRRTGVLGQTLPPTPQHRTHTTLTIHTTHLIHTHTHHYLSHSDSAICSRPSRRSEPPTALTIGPAPLLSLTRLRRRPLALPPSALCTPCCTIHRRLAHSTVHLHCTEPTVCDPAQRVYDTEVEWVGLPHMRWSSSTMLCGVRA